MPNEKRTNEISLTRVYDAPVKTVWDAWTDPQQVAQWWGPRGFTLTTHSKDLRPGGIWHYTMHGPDGVDYPNKTLYHEVEECKKLVYDHGGNDERKPLFRVTVLFSESDGKTTMEMKMGFPSAEEMEAARKIIKNAGGNTTWDRLAEYLNETEKGQSTFVINRSFPAPIDLLFKAWTDPDQLSMWLPPVGFEMEVRQADIRDGGSCFFQMSNGGDVAFYGLFEYREVDEPCRIVYVQRFCDEQQNQTRHPFAPLFPAALLTTVQLVSEGPDATRVTVTMNPHGEAKAEEVEAFIDQRSGMTQGWTGSFDKLESVICGEDVSSPTTTTVTADSSSGH